MRRQIIRLTVLLIATVYGISTASATTLYGGIGHSDYLAPMGAEPATAFNQRASAQSIPTQNVPTPKFTGEVSDGHVDAFHAVPRLVGNATAVANQAPAIEWFVVPKWMAGQWTKRGDLTVSYRDLRTNRYTTMNAWTENEMSITWGHQVDRQGNVWHADILPIEKDGWSNQKMTRFMMVALSCEETTPQQLVTRSKYMVTETYGRSSMIADMFQQESLNDYIELPTGEMENHSSNRIFSSQGQALREGSLVSRFQRTGQFAPTRYQNNIDLAASLNLYLQTHGMAHLTVNF